MNLRSILIFLVLSLPSAFSALPNNVTLEPFYDKSKVDFSGQKPIWMEEVPGLAQHFYVLDIYGAIYTLYPDASGDLVKKEILDFRDKCNGAPRKEYGAFRVMFHPDFFENNKFYILYLKLKDNQKVNTWGGITTIEEWTATGDLRDQAAFSRTIFSYEHNPIWGACMMTFGPDGYLYLYNSDYESDGWDLTDLGRKVLRIDVDNPANGKEYGIPSDNPFVNDPNPEVHKEIWASGFRNLWTMVFDPLTGVLWGGDIGQLIQEELNIVIKGRNHGWANFSDGHPIKYGRGFSGFCQTDHTKVKSTLSEVDFNCDEFQDPYYAFPRTASLPLGITSIIAGITFRGDPSSPFYGYHIFGDTNYGKLLAVKQGEDPVFIGLSPSQYSRNGDGGHDGICSFGEDLYGNIYAVFLDWNEGDRGIYKVSHSDLTERFAKYGCTNELANNHDPEATDDDGSCVVTSIQKLEFPHGIDITASGTSVSINTVEKHTVELINSQGKTVFSGHGTGAKEYNFENTNHSGIYVVKVTTDINTFTRTIVRY